MKSDAAWSTAGRVASAEWLEARGVAAPPGARWHAELALDVVDAPAVVDFDERTASRFHIDIYSEEWGFFFTHQGRASWIRVTDVAFAHGRDEHGLLAHVPPLAEIGALMRALEQRHAIKWRREHALVRTTLQDAEPAIRRWIASL